MKKYVSFFAISVLVVSSSFCDENTIPPVESVKKFEQLIADNSTVLAVQFHSGCSVCNRTRQHLKNIMSEFSTATFAEVDIKKLPDLATKYEIAALPTVLIFKSGQDVPTYTITGPTEKDLRLKMNEALKK